MAFNFQVSVIILILNPQKSVIICVHLGMTRIGLAFHRPTAGTKESSKSAPDESSSEDWTALAMAQTSTLVVGSWSGKAPKGQNEMPNDQL